METLKQHWNHIFSTKADSELGWYESDSSQTIQFIGPIIQRANLNIFLVGAGTSALADELLKRGHNLIVNDISDEALTQLKHRVGVNEDRVIWLHGDISKPRPSKTPQVDIWIDRAVLHFIVDDGDIHRYFDNLRSTVKDGGYVVLAEFSPESANRCAGLDLHRYSLEEMTERIGSGFELLQSEKYTYIMPSGSPRPYIYALYRKE
jgi:hypothetical protein